MCRHLWMVQPDSIVDSGKSVRVIQPALVACFVQDQNGLGVANIKLRA